MKPIFQKKLQFGDISKLSKVRPNWGFWPFSRLCIISFPRFCTARNDRWVWCLVAFLQFAGPVSQCILVHLLRNIKIPCFFNCFCCFCACFRFVTNKCGFLQIYSCFLILRNYHNFDWSMFPVFISNKKMHSLKYRTSSYVRFSENMGV